MKIKFGGCLAYFMMIAMVAFGFFLAYLFALGVITFIKNVSEKDKVVYVMPADSTNTSAEFEEIWDKSAPVTDDAI